MLHGDINCRSIWITKVTGARTRRKAEMLTTGQDGCGQATPRTSRCNFSTTTNIVQDGCKQKGLPVPPRPSTKKSFHSPASIAFVMASNAAACRGDASIQARSSRARAALELGSYANSACNSRKQSRLPRQQQSSSPPSLVPWPQRLSYISAPIPLKPHILTIFRGAQQTARALWQLVSPCNIHLSQIQTIFLGSYSFKNSSSF